MAASINSCGREVSPQNAKSHARHALGSQREVRARQRHGAQPEMFAADRCAYGEEPSVVTMLRMGKMLGMRAQE